jgi:ABC-type nitrate/sulfonate/bicarbonate transport system permease component
MSPGATRLVALMGGLALWALIAHGNAWLAVVNPVLLPTPLEVGRVAVDLTASGELGRHFLTSLGRVAQGFGLAALAALGLGLLVGICVPLRLMLEPVIEFVRPIPPLAFLPMFLVWFGLGEASKIVFIGYTTFFPMFVAIAAAVLRVDVVLLRAAASLGASRADLVRRVVLPAALPGIVVALRLGFGLALFVIVGAEFMGAEAGLGHLIMEGRTFFNPPQIVMGALVLGLLGSLFNMLLLAAERRLLRGRAAA